jgi:hypothetical protein
MPSPPPARAMDAGLIDRIAPVVHEAIRQWQRVNGQPVSPPWEEATWERDSTREAVALALTDPTPGQQHQKWLDERRAQGWTWGPVKDGERKTSPSLVPFNDLPEVEKAKDRLVIAIVRALAGAAGGA